MAEGNTVRKGYKTLEAFSYANRLAHLVYDLSDSFPRQETFGLISQLRRAVLSVPANIVEGYAYATGKQKRNFYQIAFASLAEVEYYLEFALERRYLDKSGFEKAELVRLKTGRCLYGLIRSTK